MRLFLHVCCAHCLEAAVAGFRAEFGGSLELVCLFHNPNIHPLLEFRRRLKAVKVLNERLKLPIRYDERYGLETFLRESWGAGAAGRCRRCYDLRLGETARRAWEEGFETFSSTLVVSSHQDHETIRQAGYEAGMRYAVDFLYRDLRSCAAAAGRTPGLYRQQYCGCVFSEAERFAPTGRELYKGPGPFSLDGAAEES